MLYYYRIYGLSVQSAIAFPEAYEVRPCEPDVRISAGGIPEEIREKINSGTVAETYGREKKWFSFPNEGIFLIEKGRSITFEPDAGADGKHVRALLLGVCLTGILYQREIPAMHSAGVVWQEQAILVCGNSGAGKSTVCSAFLQLGCSFLADDTVAVVEESETVYAQPAYPQQKLCADAALAQGYDLGHLVRLDEEREKYAVSRRDVFRSQPQRLAAMVCLDVVESLGGGNPIFREITGAKKLEYVLYYQYNYFDNARVGVTANTFRKCVAAARQTRVFAVSRLPGQDVGESIAQQVLQALQNGEVEWNGSEGAHSETARGD